APCGGGPTGRVEVARGPTTVQGPMQPRARRRHASVRVQRRTPSPAGGGPQDIRVDPVALVRPIVSHSASTSRYAWAIGRSADEVGWRCIVDAATDHCGADVSRSHAPHRDCALFCLCADADLAEY